MADLAIALELQGRDAGLSAAADKASASVRGIGDASDHATAKSGGLMGALGGVAKVAGGFIVAEGLMKLPMILGDTVAAARESALANAQLDAVIASTGGKAGITADSVRDLASEWMKVAKIDDDVILGGQNMLLTFTNIGEDVFPQATEAMLNMAAAMGTDPKQAAIQLGKALNDPIQGLSALSRVGVSFTEEQKTMIEGMVASGDVAGAQKVILNELAVEFGGAAKAIGDAKGPLEDMNLAWGEMQERIGGKLIPVLADLASKGLAAFEWLDQAGFIDAAIDGIGAAFQAAASVITGAFDLIASAAQTDFVQGLKSAFELAAATISAVVSGDMTVAIQTLEDALGIDLSGLTGAIATAQGLLQTLQDAWTTVGQVIAGEWEASDAIDPFVNALGQGVQFAKSQFDQLVAIVNQAISGDLAGAFVMLVDLFGATFVQVTTKLQEWQTAFIAWIGPMIPPFLAELQVLLGQFTDWFVSTALPAIMAQLEVWGRAFVEWIGPLIPPFISEMQTFLGQFGSWMVGTALPTIATQLQQWATAFVEWIGPMIPPFIEEMFKLLTRFSAWITLDARNDIAKALIPWAQAFWEWVQPAATELVRQLPGMLRGINDWINNAALELGKAALALGWAMVKGVIDGIGERIDGVGAALGSLLRGQITNTAKNMGSTAEEYTAATLGEPMGEGIITGLVAAFGRGDSRITEGIRAVVTTAIGFGIDPLIAASLAKAESNFNPSAVGDAGASVGLFQLHEAGQGAGMGAARLDPWVNAVKFLEQHKGLFDELSSKLEGANLAKIFGGRAEVSDPQFWHRYAEAFNEIVAALGPLGNLGTMAAAGVGQMTTALDTVDPKIAQLAAMQETLNAAIGQGFPQSAATGTRELQAFGAGAQILLDTLLAGNSSIDETQSAMIRLASSTGLAIAPAQQMQAGLIDQDAALKTVLATVAEVNPAYASTAAGFIMGATTSADATLNFLQLAASTQGVTDAVVPADDALRTMAGFMPTVSQLAIDGGLAGDELTRALLGLTEQSGFARTGLDLQTASTEDLNGALANIVDEMAIVDPRFADLNQKIKDNGGITDETRGQLVNLLDTIDDVPGTVAPAGTAYDQFGKDAKTAAGTNQEAWQDILADIRTTIKDMAADVKTGVAAIVAQLQAISKTKVDVDTKDAVKNLGKVEDAADDARKALTKLAGEKVADDVKKGVKFVSGFAEGGWSSAGMVRVTGELGPELSVSRGDYVLSHAEATAIARDAFRSRAGVGVAGSGGGAGDVYVTFQNYGTLVGPDVDDWLVESHKRLYREGRINLDVVNER